MNRLPFIMKVLRKLAAGAEMLRHWSASGGISIRLGEEYLPNDMEVYELIDEMVRHGYIRRELVSKDDQQETHRYKLTRRGKKLL